MTFSTRLTSEMAQRYRRAGFWGDQTFYAILERRAAAHPEREALVDRRHRVTYGELKARVDRVAAKLGALGVGAGDVVTIQLPNQVEFAYVFFALERLGAVANQIGPDFRSREVEYHKNPAANAELFTSDGWFRTGDLGQLDTAGNLRIVGRLKEMINRGGKKFFPREIEEILYAHPKILHAAIVGVPDPRLGERNCLCVIARPGQRVDLDEIVAFLRDDVATYKLPEMIEAFDELPFTPTGKIQRHVLVRQVLERRAGHSAER